MNILISASESLVQKATWALKKKKDPPLCVSVCLHVGMYIEKLQGGVGDGNYQVLCKSSTRPERLCHLFSHNYVFSF